MRMLSYETDQPLRQVGVLLTREEAERLFEGLRIVLEANAGYVRVEDEAWGELDISLYTPANQEFLHRRIRRLIDVGE